MSDLPTGWEWATVGSLAESLVDGPFGSNLKTEHYTSHGIRVVRLQNIGDGYFDDTVKAYISEGHASGLMRHEARSGDVLIAAMGDVLPRVCLVPPSIGSAIVKADCFRFRSGDRVNSEFIAYMLCAPQIRKSASMQIAGVGRPRLNLKKVSSLEVPLPPKDEQERIVSAIDNQFSRLNVGIESLKYANRRISSIRAAILQSAVSGVLTSGGGRPGNEGLPAGWAMCTVEEIATSSRNALAIGPFGSSLKVSDYTEHGVPLVFVRQVRSAKFGGAGTRFISEEKAEELRAHRARAGDVLITKMGEPPGDATVYPLGRPDAIVTADVIKLSVKEGISSEYIALAVNSKFVRDQFIAITRGVAQQKVSLARLRQSIRIPIPPSKEQLQIVKEVLWGMQEVDRVESTIEAQLRRSSLLRSSILMEAFAGRLAAL